MSTSGHLNERTVRSVLLALWRGMPAATSQSSPHETTIQHLLRETLAPLPDIQQAIALLRQRRCLIEHGPQATVTLLSTSLACWGDVLQEQARTQKLRLGRQVMMFSRTTSTNDMAWQCAENPSSDGLVVIADEQSAGRGRLGHGWVARPEQSILMSVLLLGQQAGASVDRLTLLAGLATAIGIERALTHSAATPSAPIDIKWPNDLLVQGKKLAGILVERRGAAVVIGIGINVTQGVGDFGPDLDTRATSLYQITGSILDRLRVAASVLQQLDHHMTQAAGDDTWINDWKSRCAMLGQRLTLRVGNRTISGQILDIDPLQGLLLRDDTGATQFLSAQTATVL